MPPSPDVLRDYAALHLTYEVKMLCAQGRALSDGLADYFHPNDRTSATFAIVGNSMLESWAIRLRLLSGFLWGQTSAGKGMTVFATDRLAVEYVRDPEAWRAAPPPIRSDYQGAFRRINTEIAHLSAHRSGSEAVGMPWLVADLSRSLLGAIRVFDRAADYDLLGDRWDREVRVPFLKAGYAFTTVAHPDDLPSPYDSTG
ncbi:MAG: hypothetical protein RLO50_10310 [Azospirillaceae bacterium]